VAGEYLRFCSTDGVTYTVGYQMTLAAWYSFLWEADGCTISQETNYLLRKPDVHYRDQKSPTLKPILKILNPSWQPIPLRSLLIFSFHIRLGLSSGIFLPFAFSDEELTWISHLQHVFHMTPPPPPNILFGLTKVIVFGGEYRL
jgi:hypothetical protein